MKFEEKIKKLEDIVATLESDTNDLEDSINKYSEALPTPVISLSSLTILAVIAILNTSVYCLIQLQPQ